MRAVLRDGLITFWTFLWTNQDLDFLVLFMGLIFLRFNLESCVGVLLLPDRRQAADSREDVTETSFA